jgi:hypothetical protein
MRRLPRLASATLLALVMYAGHIANAHDRFASVTWSGDVQPIVDRKCSACHQSGGSARPSLATYDEVRANAAAVKNVVLAREMPPWAPARGYGAFRNDPSLSPQQISIIASWIEAGMPFGDPAAPAGATASRRPTEFSRGALSIKIPASWTGSRSVSSITLEGSGRLNVAGWRVVTTDTALSSVVIRSGDNFRWNWTPSVEAEMFPLGAGYQVDRPTTLQIEMERLAVRGEQRSAPTEITLELALSPSPLRLMFTTRQTCGTTAAVRPGRILGLRPVGVTTAPVEIRMQGRQGERVLGRFPRVRSMDQLSYWLREPATLERNSRLEIRGVGPCTVEVIQAAG